MKLLDSITIEYLAETLTKNARTLVETSYNWDSIAKDLEGAWKGSTWQEVTAVDLFYYSFL